MTTKEQRATAPEKTHKRGLFGGVFGGKHKSAENSASGSNAPSGHPVSECGGPGGKAPQLPRHSSFVASKRATVILPPGATSLMSSLGATTGPDISDLSKASRPEQRRILLERQKKLTSFKSILLNELAQVDRDLREVADHLEKLKLFDDLNMDGSAAASSCAQAKDDKSAKSRKSVLSFISEAGGRRKRDIRVTLEEVIERDGRSIPRVIQAAVDFLRDEERISSEGLFRVSPTSTSVTAVIKLFATGKICDFAQSDLCLRDHNIVCTILKQFLRELAQPIITAETYSCLATLHRSAHGDIEAKALREVLEKTLPRPNKVVLNFLTQFLSQVVAHESSNKMNSFNLATCFAPVLFHTEQAQQGTPFDVSAVTISSDVARQIIDHYSELFTCPPPAAEAHVVAVSAVPPSAAATAPKVSPARSPKRQAGQTAGAVATAAKAHSPGSSRAGSQYNNSRRMSSSSVATSTSGRSARRSGRAPQPVTAGSPRTVLTAAALAKGTSPAPTRPVDPRSPPAITASGRSVYASQRRKSQIHGEAPSATVGVSSSAAARSQRSQASQAQRPPSHVPATSPTSRQAPPRQSIGSATSAGTSVSHAPNRRHRHKSKAPKPADAPTTPEAN